MHGRKWASAAELNVSSGASQRQIVVSVDSDADNSMKLAADGNINTYWHTVHNQFYIAPYPHEIHLSLSKEATIKGIRYTPRQDSEEGRIASYEVYASKDGKIGAAHYLWHLPYRYSNANYRIYSLPGTLCETIGIIGP